MLKKSILFLVPGDSSSWILLDSNGSKNEESIKETAKMDIFSQAMASAEIGDFAENNSKKSHYSKSQFFVQKFNFDKTTTFSRVFTKIFFDNFSREIKVVNS